MRESIRLKTGLCKFYRGAYFSINAIFFIIFHIPPVTTYV